MQVPLRSERSVDHAYVTFVNRTTRMADLVWFNFTGDMVRYAILGPGEEKHINTFKGHPWKSFDHASGSQLHLNGKYVFYPVSVREIHQRLQLVHVPFRSLRCRRSEITISVPESSLYCLCKELILQFIRTVEDIQCLDIPEVVKADLRKMFLWKEEYYRSLQEHVVNGGVG